ncbi:MAG: matrixin family metalloprotease [Deltaproteobacteria bacterium]
MSSRALFVGLALACSSLGLALDAAAFCRTRTCEFRSDVACPRDALTGCYGSGEFVYWKSGCVPYAVQRDGSADEGITALQLADLIDQGFAAWSDLACPGGNTPLLSTSRQGLIACHEVEFNCMAGSQNSNLVMFQDDFVNTDFGLRFGVIALTTVTANLRTGEIFDADMEINSRDEDFSLDASGPGNDRRDLRGVINHELGHLLGLSHSNEGGALMRALYQGTVRPASDDAAGMCAALATGANDPACTVELLDSGAVCLGPDSNCTRIGADAPEDPAGGCACRTASAQPAGPAAWAWALGLALWALRRKSQSRQRVL